MPRKRYKPEEIVTKVRQVDVLVSQGSSVANAIRQIGVSEVTYYLYGRLPVARVKVNWLRRSVAKSIRRQPTYGRSAQMGYPHARASTGGRPRRPR